MFQVILFVVSTSGIQAQPLFERTYGSAGPDVGEAVAITPGGMVVVGSTFGLGGADQDVLILLERDGEADWSVRTGGPGADVAFDVLSITNNELWWPKSMQMARAVLPTASSNWTGLERSRTNAVWDNRAARVRCRLAALTDSTFLLVGSHETAPPDLLLSSVAGIYRTDGTVSGSAPGRTPSPRKRMV